MKGDNMKNFINNLALSGVIVAAIGGYTYTVHQNTVDQLEGAKNTITVLNKKTEEQEKLLKELYKNSLTEEEIDGKINSRVKESEVSVRRSSEEEIRRIETEIQKEISSIEE